MVNTSEFKTLLWKELLDLYRDKKTIFTSIILPLISLPLIGLTGLALVEQQAVNIAVVDLDNSTYTNDLLNLTISSKWVVGNLTNNLRKYGYNVSVYSSKDILEKPYIDLVVIIPVNFSRNASSLNTAARITVLRKAGVQAAIRAESIIYNIIDYFSKNISDLKIRALSRLINETIKPEALRNPVSAYTRVVGIYGQAVSPEVEFRNFFARILVLGFSFVVTPAASFVIDGIIGERERKTIELLLATPLTPQLIIWAKLVAATVLGLITALADIAGLLIYMASFSLMLGVSFAVIVDPLLIIIHAVTAFFTILVTISIALPFITRTKGIRSASNIVGIVTIVSLIFFFTGFYIDYIKLPENIIIPLYFIPYTHSILVIQSYIIGYTLRAFIHIMVLAFTSLIILYIASKMINTEKLLLAE